MSTTDPNPLTKQIQAIYHLKTLLELIIKSPHEFKDNPELVRSLKSQGSTASLAFQFEIDKKTITLTPMSLNSLKRYANAYNSEGFRGLDNLRIRAHDNLILAKQKVVTSNKNSKSGMLLRIGELEDIAQKTRQANFILLQAISQSMLSITSIVEAPNAKIRAKRALEALKSIRAIVDICPEPFNTIPHHENITPIHGNLT